MFAIHFFPFLRSFACQMPNWPHAKLAALFTFILPPGAGKLQTVFGVVGVPDAEIFYFLARLSIFFRHLLHVTFLFKRDRFQK